MSETRAEGWQQAPSRPVQRFGVRQGALPAAEPAPGRLEIACIALAMAQYTGALPWNLFTAASSDDFANIDASNTAVQALILLGTMLFMLRRWRGVLDVALRALPLALPLLVVVVSCLWADQFGRSVRRIGSFGVMNLFALYAIAAIGQRRIMRISVWIAVWGALASLALLLIYPDIAYDEDVTDSLRGIYAQKNLFGEAMLVGCAAISYAVLDRRRFVLSDVAFLAVFVTGLVLSKSVSAGSISVLVGAFTLVGLMLRRGGFSTALGVIMLAGIVVLVLLFSTVIGLDTLLDSVGKNTTLTGRLDIWDAVARQIATRPALGFGFGGFWLPGQPETEQLWADVGWIVPSAHSGYLETMLQLGYAGMASLALLTLMLLGRIVGNLFDRQRQGMAFWALIYLVEFCALNYDESRMLVTGATWIFLMTAVISLGGRPLPEPVPAAAGQTLPKWQRSARMPRSAN